MTDRPRERIPDGITPLVGYRAWQVVEEAAGLVFYPLSHRSREWVDAPRGWAIARCPLDPEARLTASRFHPGWLDDGTHDGSVKRPSARTADANPRARTANAKTGSSRIRHGIRTKKATNVRTIALRIV